MLRVLVISRECWRADSNEGSVLTSLFSGQPFEFANIYCKPGAPDNGVCARYFQLTDRMAADRLLHGKKTPMGRAFTQEPGAPQQAPERENRRFYDFFRRNNLAVFQTLRELLWKLAGVDEKGVAAFVHAFQPDVIFAPLCYSEYVLRVHRIAAEAARCPVVTYAYDDLYSLRQFRFSPLFWVNRFSLRHAIRKTLPYYAYAYTMSEEQAREYGPLLGLPMRVLQKCADTVPAAPHAPRGGEVRFLYAGGVYYGRDRTLMRIADAVRACRADGLACRMDVYTNSPLAKRALTSLDDGAACRVHAAVPRDALLKAYADSDVALHVESFRLRDRCTTRLSFSSKIVDCLMSGCAVLAVCPGENAGYRYLADAGAAVCVDAPAAVEAAVRRLVGDPAFLRDKAAAALALARRAHDAATVRARLCSELTALSAAEQKSEA